MNIGDMRSVPQSLRHNAERFKIALERREFRFLLVGASLAAFYFGVVFSLVKFRGFSPFMSSVLAYVCALGLGYIIQRNWSFRARHSHLKALPRYILLQAACAMFSGLSAQIAMKYFQMPPLTLSIVSTLTVSLVSFVVSLTWVFPNEPT
jgi:putative flippase GtrA